MKQSRLFGIVLTAALAVLFFTAVTPAVVSAATIYVPEGGNQTIQQAVNNATAGDTIIVRDGTYRENVDVGVAHLTIRSENGSANCIVNASDSNDHVFAVTVSYVNISGFTVENATDWGMAGIYLGGGVEHCNISDNTASHNRRGIRLEGSLRNLLANNTANLNEDYGIYLSFSNYNNLMNNTASHNNHDGIRIESSINNDIEGGNVSYNDNKGIYIMAGVTSYNNVTGVLVTGNAIGIGLSDDNCVIKNNTLNFNTDKGIHITGWDSTDNKIINNTVNNSLDGIYIESNSNLVEDNIANSNDLSGILLLDCSDNEIIGNVANNNNYGISMFMWTNANHNITSNTLSDNNDCGIYVEYCGGCNISNNTVNNNTWGISVVDGWDSEITCNWVHHNNERGINVACTDYNISKNNIMFNGVPQGDDSYHWNFYNDQTDAVDAKHNYWVATDNETIDKSIYDDEEGTGEVTFYPPLEGASPCAPIPELVTVVLLGVGLLALLGYVRIRRKDKG